MGVKKAKQQKKNKDKENAHVSEVKEQNSMVLEILQKSNLHRQEFLQLEREKLAFKRMAREEKIMNMDSNAISDPAQRSYYQLKKDEILHKRTMEFQKSNPQSSSNIFSQYFSDIGGDRNVDIPPY
ncbi:uncharacterized protein LOC127250849 [Andrographis paniculata]|uniref:uncharacterized protein LOC127250849 n=1 Tax=Andrographis paniculata TaxID=175694 RepID=UPI0021E7700C|nr:uncharacterized protein LOC127250849 [Andrographis paniculata]